eukprot:XP_025015755.1 linoleate 13S-lipoxygenase 3-1, chloroplastic [Ricinus communis]
MALAKEFMGSSLIDKSSFVSTSKAVFFNHNFPQKNQFLVSTPPGFVSLQQRKIVNVKRIVKKGPVAAISEDLIKANNSHDITVTEKAVKFKVRAVVTVRNKHKEDFKETIAKQLDAFADKIGRNVVLELISTEVDPRIKAPKRSKAAVLKDWSKKANVKTERVHYTAEFIVDSNFGVPGAITVSNKHQQEFFLEEITLEGFASGPVHFPCNSWVQSKKDHPGERIFFSNEVLEHSFSIRLILFFIILCQPKKLCNVLILCMHYMAPDVNAESRVEKPSPIYVPRDEQFEESKKKTFSAGRLKAVLHTLIPSLKASISAENHDFTAFSDFDILYREGLLLKVGIQDEIWRRLPLPKVVTTIQESSEGLLRYDTPKILSRDKFAWLRDDEFARQAISGVNPVNIESLKVFPPKSNLDPETYGPLESALKEEHIIGHLNGMSVQEALEENKLFIVDYHDAYLPFLDRINALDGRKAYATRTIFFLTPLGTLKPIAIELSLPPTAPSARSKRAVTPPVDATTTWIWQLAKAHVCSNDAGVHQLVNHWLRTHACLEPFILAAHRQLSSMHPIFKLLDPHMRYTLEINALARQSLISADGVIENCFTPGRYCMEISAAAYKDWRFDMEGLPSDLIRRGMAVPDPTQPHGLKLLLEDYPYAQDGLLIWFAIENWVRTYVNRYYPNSSIVGNDRELQAWYAESVNVGHADLRHADWWPTLATVDDLVSILTILIWLASAQHAALNFGQYPYGGYVPNRPTLTRRLIPEETDPEYESFIEDPQKYFLSALPSLLQATKLMAVVDTLSTHSPDEEYLGERQQPSTWSGDAEMIESFYEFSAEMGRIEKEIERRNKDPKLRNRCGAGVLPYELLAPSSEPGVTCRGVPNSVSI